VPVQVARELQGAAAHGPLPEPFFNGLIAESLKLPVGSGGAGLMACSRSVTRRTLGRIAGPTLLTRGEWGRWLLREEEDQLAVQSRV
jgi:hypothetical protein